MRNLLKFRRITERPSLKERAAGLKATLSQVVAQPRPMPAPGSEEAKAAFKDACHQHTIRTQFANGYPELKRTEIEWWTVDSIGKALETGELTPAECARLYPLATERELRMAEIEHELNLGDLFALAFAESYPVAADEPDTHAVEDKPGADAELVHFGRQFEVARQREIAACEACNAAQREADQHMPARPACLILRASDHPLHVYRHWMHPEALEGIQLDTGDVEWLRRKMPMTHEVLRPIREGERAHVDHPGRKFDIVPHPEAQARAEEIVAAWDAWHAERLRIHGEYVTEALDDAANNAGNVAAALAERIAALPALTAEGFRVKLRALSHYRRNTLLSEITDEPDPDQLLSNSLWRDVQDEVQPAAEPVDWFNPPAGFMAHPAIEPQGFLIVREGLRLELERLHRIALAEFSRKSEGLRERMSEDQAREREAEIRAELFLSPLTAAVDPESDGAAALRAVGRLVEPDPVLAAIAASRRAEAEMDAFSRGIGRRRITSAEITQEDKLVETQRVTRAVVWATVPTTSAGLRALVEYAEFQAELTFGDKWRDHARHEHFGDAFLALAAAIKAQAALDIGPDAAIAELAEEFCRAYRINAIADRAMMAGTGTEADWKPHYDATIALSKKLEAAKPTTLIGMALKCIVPVALEAWQLSGHDASDERDYGERVAAEFETAILGDTLRPILPGPLSRGTLTPDRAWAVAQAAAVDLSGLTVLQLNCLFACFADASDRWLDITQSPWASSNPDSSFLDLNAAGQIADREHNRAAEIRSRIADEIRGRKPLDQDEHDWRLDTLIRYEIMCEGSLRRAPELRAEIAKAWGA